MFVCICVCIYMHRYICIYIYIHTYMYVYKYIYIYIIIYTYIYIYTYTYIHIYKYTHTQASRRHPHGPAHAHAHTRGAPPPLRRARPLSTPCRPPPRRSPRSRTRPSPTLWCTAKPVQHGAGPGRGSTPGSTLEYPLFVCLFVFGFVGVGRSSDRCSLTFEFRKE